MGARFQRRRLGLASGAPEAAGIHQENVARAFRVRRFLDDRQRLLVERFRFRAALAQANDVRHQREPERGLRRVDAVKFLDDRVCPAGGRFRGGVLALEEKIRGFGRQCAGGFTGVGAVDFLRQLAGAREERRGLRIMALGTAQAAPL